MTFDHCVVLMLKLSTFAIIKYEPKSKRRKKWKRIISQIFSSFFSSTIQPSVRVFITLWPMNVFTCVWLIWNPFFCYSYDFLIRNPFNRQQLNDRWIFSFSHRSMATWFFLLALFIVIVVKVKKWKHFPFIFRYDNRSKDTHKHTCKISDDLFSSPISLSR